MDATKSCIIKKKVCDAVSAMKIGVIRACKNSETFEQDARKGIKFN